MACDYFPHQALVSDARERDLEIVRSVKEAEHKGAQVEAQAHALVTARAATEVIRQQLHLIAPDCT